MSGVYLPTAQAFGTQTAMNGSRSEIKAKAGEFESLLLTQWLQSAQATLGSAPGASDDDDAEAQQWTGFAVQQLARGISERGGIGIGKLVQQALEKAGKASQTAATGMQPEVKSR